MMYIQEVIHAEIACGLQFWIQSSIKPALLESEY